MRADERWFPVSKPLAQPPTVDDTAWASTWWRCPVCQTVSAGMPERCEVCECASPRIMAGIPS